LHDIEFCDEYKKLISLFDNQPLSPKPIDYNNTGFEGYMRPILASNISNNKQLKAKQLG